MRTWKAPGLPDLELDPIKEEMMAQLGAIGNSDAFSLVKDIIEDLQGYPSLTSINAFLKRFNLLTAEAVLAPSLYSINRQLLNLKIFLSSFSFSHQYSADDINTSRSFKSFSANKPPTSDEEVSSQGSYKITPTKEEIQKGLKLYDRNNRPLLQFVDEITGGGFERSDKETETPSLAVFAQKIYDFCDKDRIATGFICANLGIEPLGFISCENIHSLLIADGYMKDFFSADHYTLRWRKLKDPDGSVYYLHELYWSQGCLKTTTGEIHCLNEASCTDLKTVTATDYEVLLKAGKIIPLISVAATVELRIVARAPQIKVAQYSVNITTSAIELKAPFRRSSVLVDIDPEAERARGTSPAP